MHYRIATIVLATYLGPATLLSEAGANSSNGREACFDLELPATFGEPISVEYDLGNENFSPPRRPLREAGAAAKAASGWIGQWLSKPLALGPGSAHTLRSVGSVTRKHFVEYRIDYEDIPLSKHTSILAILNENGDLAAVRRRGIPQSVDGLKPTVELQIAQDVALKHFVDITGKDHIPIMTYGNLELIANSHGNANLSWHLLLDNDTPFEPHVYEYWIAAIDSPVLLRVENRVLRQIQGSVAASLWEGVPPASTAQRPLADVDVGILSETTNEISTTTDDAGLFSLPPLKGSRVRVSARLDGVAVRVTDSGGAAMERLASTEEGRSLDLMFDASDQEELAQTTAYYWTTIAYNFIGEFFMGHPVGKIKAEVNVDGFCNAFYHQRTMRFNTEGEGCVNSAYNDIIFHEYGHALDEGFGEVLDAWYSEGFGDALATLLTRQPCTGRGFFGDGTCLRNATDDNKWPPSPFETEHEAGKRYSQFVWNLVRELNERYDEDQAYDVATSLVLGAAASNPGDIPDAVCLTFLVDDDDGNLTNGSPHFEELRKAADARNLPRPRDPS